MSSSNGVGGGGGGAVVTTNKMLQSMKEILGGSNGCPEEEIYAMLKECNMDPSEAVHRLLNRDTFHEVKSKRDKKKEIKENLESRSRGVSNGSKHGSRGGVDCAGCIGSTKISTNEYGGSCAKPIAKKENGVGMLPSPLMLGSCTAGNSTIKSFASVSDSVKMENAAIVVATADGIPSQPSAGFQHSWVGVPSQVTLADIVRMGRPAGKASRTPVVPTESYASHISIVSNNLQLSAKHTTATTMPSELHQVHFSQGPALEVSEISHEPSVSLGLQIPHDECSLVDRSAAANGLPVLETPDASCYADSSLSSSLLVDGANSHRNSRVDGIRDSEGNTNSDNSAEDSTRSITAPDRQVQVDNSGGESDFGDESFKNVNYQPQVHTFEHHKV